MSIIAANMNNCDVKFRCQAGVNKGVAYSIEEPCFGDQTFDADLCDCLPYFECGCSCNDGCQDCHICVGGQCVFDPACDDATHWCLNVDTGQCDSDGNCRMNCFPIEEGVPFGVAVRIKDGTKSCGESGCVTQKSVTITYSDGIQRDSVVNSGCCNCVEFKAEPYITYRSDGVTSGPCDSPPGEGYFVEYAWINQIKGVTYNEQTGCVGVTNNYNGAKSAFVSNSGNLADKSPSLSWGYTSGPPVNCPSSYCSTAGVTTLNGVVQGDDGESSTYPVESVACRGSDGFEKFFNGTGIIVGYGATAQEAFDSAQAQLTS